MKWPPTICRLCLRKGEIQRSHIISEFLHKSAYDKKHRAKLVERGGSIDHPQTVQKGIRESLLCRTCEGRLGEWERHAAQVLNQSVRHPFSGPGHPQVEAVAVEGVDYAKFKLFQMSILWKASISSQRMFKVTRLHPTHVEQLRSMLFQGEPGAPHRYGCLVLEPGYEKLERLVTVSRPIDYGAFRVHKFLMGRLEWWFFVWESWDGKPFSDYLLNPSGVLPIIAGDSDIAEVSWLKMAQGMIDSQRSSDKTSASREGE